jgi:predicted transcriptional regulator
MSDNISNAFNFLDTKIHKVRTCMETYINKFGSISNATFFAIVRTTETEVIKQCQLPDTRMIHNNLRMYILDRLIEE